MHSSSNPTNGGNLVSEQQLQRLVSISSLVHQWRNSDMSVKDFCAEHQLACSSFYEWIQKEKLGPHGLMDRRANNGRKPELQNEALVFVLGFLAQRRRATIVGAWRALESVAKSEGWQYPCYQTVVRAVGKLPPDLREVMAHGGRAAFERWGLVKRVESSRPNEVWQIDASELPVWATDMTTGEQFKPWCIGMIDVATRVVQTLTIFRNAPSTADVLLALRSAILPKNDARFPFFGCPAHIQCDSGSIFQSADFLDACLRLNIAVDTISKSCPSENGKCERMFRTVQDGLCRNLIQHSEQYRGLNTAKANPLPFTLLPRLVADFLNGYHLRRHSSLGKSPLEAWDDMLSDIVGMSFMAQDVIDACMVRVTRRVRRDGIEMAPGVHYSSAGLVGLVGKEVVLRMLPEGGDSSPECYYQGQSIGTLERVEFNTELAEHIKKARLERAIELSRLRKTLLKTAARILPGSVPTSHGPLPILLPPPGGASQSDEQDCITEMEIPRFGTLDAEEADDLPPVQCEPSEQPLEPLQSARHPRGEEETQGGNSRAESSEESGMQAGQSGIPDARKSRAKSSSMPRGKRSGKPVR